MIVPAQSNKALRKVIFKKAQAYQKEYKNAESRLVRAKRQVCGGGRLLELA